MGWTTKLMHERWKFDQKLKTNELDFIWKYFHSISWRNKSHLILRCILWYSIKNKFSQSTMKFFVSWGSMKEKFEVWWKKSLCFENGVRSLSFVTLESFHTSQTSMIWKILENLHKILSTLENLKQNLTLSLPSCSPKLKCANEAHGIEMSGYIGRIGEG